MMKNQQNNSQNRENLMEQLIISKYCWYTKQNPREPVQVLFWIDVYFIIKVRIDNID